MWGDVPAPTLPSCFAFHDGSSSLGPEDTSSSPLPAGPGLAPAPSFAGIWEPPHPLSVLLSLPTAQEASSEFFICTIFDEALLVEILSDTSGNSPCVYIIEVPFVYTNYTYVSSLMLLFLSLYVYIFLSY